jgi:hypothetical protein
MKTIDGMKQRLTFNEIDGVCVCIYLGRKDE